MMAREEWESKRQGQSYQPWAQWLDSNLFVTHPTMLYSCPLLAIANTNLLHGLPWSSQSMYTFKRTRYGRATHPRIHPPALAGHRSRGCRRRLWVDAGHDRRATGLGRARLQTACL